MTMDRTVLVTGGTGALGRELVRRLARDPGARVVVLSRAARDPERIAAGDPLVESLGWSDGVRVVRGDVLAGGELGLSSVAREELSREVTDVLHCAAATRFNLPLDEARSANVGGTRSVLDFAAGCRALRRIGVFSTVYVAGRRTGRFAEDDLEDGGAGFVNTYEQSKNEMEREVRARMEELPLAVYRLSTLIGDSTTGAVTGYNAFHHAMRLLYHGLAPMVPGERAHRIDVVAVDYVADAAVWLFERRFEGGRTYHLCSGPERTSTLDDLIDQVIAVFHRIRPEWRRRGIEKPAVVGLPTYELFVRSVEETGNEVLRRATRAVQSFAYQLAFPKEFDATRTVAALLGSGLRPPAVREYLPRVIETCVDSDWGGRAA